MIATDLGYGNGLWLDAPAASSLWRINAQIGRRLDINEAGRTYAQQAKFRYDYLYNGGSYALPPGTSIHEQGRAVDTDDRFISIMADHGWFQTALAVGEAWHFEYSFDRDNHRYETASGGAVAFPTAPIPELPKEDDMYAVRQDGVDNSGIIIRGSDAPYTLDDGQFNLVAGTFGLRVLTLAKWQYDGIVNQQWIAFNTNKKLLESGVDRDDADAIIAGVKAAFPDLPKA